MDLYRVVTETKAKRAVNGGVPPTERSSGAEWSGENRLYFWATHKVASSYREFLMRRERLRGGKPPRLVVLRVNVPDQDARFENDPTVVARDFGDVFYVIRRVKRTEVVGFA